MSQSERVLRARLAAHMLHAKRDPREQTAKARAAFKKKFEDLADPEGALSPEERARRADQLEKAHYVRMALASARARRLRETKLED